MIHGNSDLVWFGKFRFDGIRVALARSASIDECPERSMNVHRILTVGAWNPRLNSAANADSAKYCCSLILCSAGEGGNEEEVISQMLRKEIKEGERRRDWGINILRYNWSEDFPGCWKWEILSGTNKYQNRKKRKNPRTWRIGLISYWITYTYVD